MKTELFEFQLPKEKMNELRGGVQICHCGGSDNYFPVYGTDKFKELDAALMPICGEDAGWSCTPQK